MAHGPLVFLFTDVCVTLVTYRYDVQCVSFKPPGCSKAFVWQYLILNIRTTCLSGCRIIIDI